MLAVGCSLMLALFIVGVVVGCWLVAFWPAAAHCPLLVHSGSQSPTSCKAVSSLIGDLYSSCASKSSRRRGPRRTKRSAHSSVCGVWVDQLTRKTAAIDPCPHGRTCALLCPESDAIRNSAAAQNISADVDLVEACPQYNAFGAPRVHY